MSVDSIFLDCRGAERSARHQGCGTIDCSAWNMSGGLPRSRCSPPTAVTRCRTSSRARTYHHRARPAEARDRARRPRQDREGLHRAADRRPGRSCRCRSRRITTLGGSRAGAAAVHEQRNRDPSDHGRRRSRRKSRRDKHQAQLRARRRRGYRRRAEERARAVPEEVGPLPCAAGAAARRMSRGAYRASRVRRCRRRRRWRRCRRMPMRCWLVIDDALRTRGSRASSRTGSPRMTSGFQCRDAAARDHAPAVAAEVPVSRPQAGSAGASTTASNRSRVIVEIDGGIHIRRRRSSQSPDRHPPQHAQAQRRRAARLGRARVPRRPTSQPGFAPF